MGDFGPKVPQSVVDQENFSVRIIQRASTASDKVKQRVETVFVPKFQLFGPNAERWLTGLQNEFFHIGGPDDMTDGNYVGWTRDEIKELYFVLYGEEMF